MSAPEPEPGRPRTTLDDVVRTLRDYVRDSLPGDEPVRLVVLLRSGEEIRLPVPPAAAGPDCVLSADGRVLVWFGRRWAFTGEQVPAVRLLVAAYESGVRDVGAAALLEAGEAPGGGRVRDLFKSSTAWQEGVIGQVSRGTFRLVRPDEID